MEEELGWGENILIGEWKMAFSMAYCFEIRRRDQERANVDTDKNQVCSTWQRMMLGYNGEYQPSTQICVNCRPLKMTNCYRLSGDN